MFSTTTEKRHKSGRETFQTCGAHSHGNRRDGTPHLPAALPATSMCHLHAESTLSTRGARPTKRTVITRVPFHAFPKPILSFPGREPADPAGRGLLCSVSQRLRRARAADHESSRPAAHQGQLSSLFSRATVKRQ